MTLSNDFTEIKVKLYYKRIIVDSKTLQVMQMPDPLANTIGFGLETNGQLKKSQLPDIKELTITYPPNYPKQFYAKVTNYQITLLKGQRVLANQYVNNNMLDENLKKQLLALSAGDRIQINNIVGQDITTGTMQNLGSKTFTIVE